MKVKDVMTKDIIVVDKDIDLQHVLTLMKKNEITKIPVMEDKKLIGIITDSMIAMKLGAIHNRGIPPSRLHASSVTDKEMDIISPEDTVKDILTRVGEPGPTLLCVVENDKLVGIVTKADLLHLVTCEKKLREIMRRELFTMSPDDRIIHARRLMIDNHVARLPVLKEGMLVGMISDNEIAFALAKVKRSIPLGKQKHRLEELTVGEVMRSPAFWTEPNMSSAEAAKIMLKHNVGALPLLENNKIVGIVSRTDLLKTISC
jgi:CBS domain-containing protein